MIYKPKIGEKVFYTSPHGSKENGIVKQIGETIIFVVFKCDNNWESFKDYTGQACNSNSLTRGWVDDKGKLLKEFLDHLIKGDSVICIDDDCQDEDLGMSGIVLPGRRDLTIGKEYEVESVDESQVPKQTKKSGMIGEYLDEKIWTDEEYKSVKKYWTNLWLKGISKPASAGLFRLKK